MWKSGVVKVGKRLATKMFIARHYVVCGFFHCDIRIVIGPFRRRLRTRHLSKNRGPVGKEIVCSCSRVDCLVGCCLVRCCLAQKMARLVAPQQRFLTLELLRGYPNSVSKLEKSNSRRWIDVLPQMRGGSPAREPEWLRAAGTFLDMRWRRLGVGGARRAHIWTTESVSRWVSRRGWKCSWRWTTCCVSRSTRCCSS